MLSGCAHRFREFRAARRDILPQSGRNANRRIVPLHVAVQWKQDSAFEESRQKRRGEVCPDFVLAQPSRFTAGVETLGAERPQIVIPVVRGNVPYSCCPIRVGGPDDCVQGQSIETIRLRRAAKERSKVLGKIDVATHPRAPGGGLTGGEVLGLTGAGVVDGAAAGAGVAGFADAGWVAGSILTTAA